MPTLEAQPFDLEFEVPSPALVSVDFQRDFMLPGGFGELLGNDVSLLWKAVEPAARVLERAREAGMLIVHTREGHASDLSDWPPAKLHRGGQTWIGTEGPMGRVLVRGSEGHDIIPELYPREGEVVLDKPGKGAFWATDLHRILSGHGIKTLIFAGVTTEVCVQTTMREANDRGYECVALSDCMASYFPAFHQATLEMIQAQGAIVGWVTDSISFLNAMSARSM